MKLLSPQATQDSTNADIARAVFRIEEMKKVEQEWRMKLANAEADFNDMLAKNRKAWEDEELSHKSRKARMEEELKVIKPIQQTDNTDYERKIAEVDLLLTQTKEKESNLDELTEKLEDKLDGLGSREKDIEQKERQLLSRELGIKEQSNQIKEQSEKLSSSLALFALDKSKFEKEQKEKQEAMFMLQRSSDSKLDSLRGKEEKISKREAELEKKKTELIEKKKELEKPVLEIEQKANELLKETIEKQKELAEREGMVSRKELELTEAIKSQWGEVNERKTALDDKGKKAGELAGRLQNEWDKFFDKQTELKEQQSVFEAGKKEWEQQIIIFQEEKEALLQDADKKLLEAREFMFSSENALNRANQATDEAKKLNEEAENRFLTAVDKEQNNHRREQKLAQNLREYDLANSTLAEQQRAFNIGQEEFVKEKIKIQRELDDRLMKIDAKERAFSAKESRVSSQEKMLSEWAIRLKDQEGALQRAKTEILG